MPIGMIAIPSMEILPINGMSLANAYPKIGKSFKIAYEAHMLYDEDRSSRSWYSSKRFNFIWSS